MLVVIVVIVCMIKEGCVVYVNGEGTKRHKTSFDIKRDSRKTKWIHISTTNKVIAIFSRLFITTKRQSDKCKSWKPARKCITFIKLFLYFFVLFVMICNIWLPSHCSSEHFPKDVLMNRLENYTKKKRNSSSNSWHCHKF